MARYTVQDPSGNTRIIEGPDGASDEEIINQAKLLLGGQAPKPEAPAKSDDELRREAIQQAFDESTGLQKFGIGVAKPFVEAYHGIRQGLGGEEDESAQERLRAIRGGAATAGEIAGNVALFAAPGGAATRIGMRAGPAAGLAADVLAGSALSGTQAVGRGDTFGQGAAEGAIGAGLGAGVGKVAATAARGMKPGSKLAQDLVDAGVPLTPGQYANGPVRWTEDRLAALPIIGDKILKRQQEAMAPYNRETLRAVVSDVAGPNALQIVTEGGAKGFRQADDHFKNLWNGLDSRTLDLNGTKTSGSAVHQTLKQLKGDISDAKRAGNSDLVRSLEKELDDYRAAVPDSWLDAYDGISAAYESLTTIGRTAKMKGPLENEGVFTPAELLRATAARTRGADKRLARGENKLAVSAAEAQKVIGKSAPGLAERVVNPLLGVGAAVAAPLPTLGAAVGALPFATKTGGKWARGELATPTFAGPRGAPVQLTQKQLKALEEELKKMGLKGSNIGAGLFPDVDGDY